VEKTKSQHFGHSRTVGLVFRRSPEPAPEASEPGTVGTRFSGIKPRLPPPSETNGATRQEQKNERGKGHPERRRGIGDKLRVFQSPNLVLDEREEGDIDSKCDECDGSGEERCKGGEEGNRDVGGKREEESNE